MDPEIQKSMAAMRMFRQQQQNCMAKVAALKQTAKRVELTAKEITSLPEDVPLYAAVGRCYVFKSRTAIDTGMAEQQKQLAEQIDKTEAQKVILEKKEKETKETVEELMKNKQPK
jgi:chaperonin cofactor prefoldin